MPDTQLRKGLRPFDPAKHARFTTSSELGFSFPPPTYPIDKTGGISNWGMDGNGPDPALTVNGGRPVGDCGVCAVPAHAAMLTAAVAGADVAANTPSADEVVTLYFTYEAEQAGVAWRPPPVGTAWTQTDLDQAAQLDQGVDLGDYLLWLVKRGDVEAFVAIDLAHLDAALDFFDCIVVGVNCNPQIDQQFNQGLPFDVGPGDQPDPNEGHALLYAKAASPSGPFGWVTWAVTYASTLAWKNACPQQAFAIVTRQEAEAKGFTDKYQTMVDAVRQLAGTVVPDPPAPPAPDTPPPAPAPPQADTDSLVRVAIEEIRHVADETVRAIQLMLNWATGRTAPAAGAAIPPLPTWTDPGSVALFLAGVLGNKNGIWTLAAPWNPHWTAIAQALIPIASFATANTLIAINVWTHRKAAVAAHLAAQDRAAIRDALDEGSHPGVNLQWDISTGPVPASGTATR